MKQSPRRSAGRARAPDPDPVPPSVRKLVLDCVVTLIGAPTLEDMHLAITELYGALYREAERLWAETAPPARDLAEACFDARVTLPAKVVTYFERAITELAAADRYHLVPEHLHTYLKQVLRLIESLLADQRPDAEVGCLWPTVWQLNFEYAARELGLQHVRDWTPPPRAKHGVDTNVIRDRLEMWHYYCALEQGRGFKFRRGGPPRPWTAGAFCHRPGRPQINLREFQRWLAGTLPEPETCITSKVIQTELRCAIKHLEELGVRPFQPAPELPPYSVSVSGIPMGTRLIP